MNRDLILLEEKILSFLEKKSKKGKSFSLLFIADYVDPRNKFVYTVFETILKKLELEGTLYHYEDDTWSLFPNNELVQGVVKKNEKGTALIDLEDGRRFILNPKDAGYVLNRDIVVFKPTKKTSGGRFVSDLDKVIKRHNGLIVVKYYQTIHGFELLPLTTKLDYPTSLPEADLEGLNTYDQLLIQIDELNYAGVFEAKLIKKVSSQQDNDFVKENLMSDTEYEGVEYKEDKQEVNPSLRKQVRETIYDSNDLKTYIKNASKIKKELKLDNYTVVGEIFINKYGDGFVEVEDKRYKVRKEFLADVFSGDIVKIRPSTLQSHGVINSIIEEVVERKNGLVIVEVAVDKDHEIVLKPVNANLKHKIVLPKDFDKPLVEGELLLVKIGTELEKGSYVMDFIKSIGHKDDPDIDLKTIAAECEIEIDFTEEEMTEANAIPQEVTEEDKVGRVDFTEEKVFSIDCLSTKDRDDALSIKKLENGNYLVGIHIADVTHYIKPGMALWDAIMRRATSVYMLDTVIPMLPHVLSNGILSLHPGEERLTVSYMAELNPDGEVVKFDIVDSVIKSRKAMIYNDVNKVLEGDIVPDGYEDYVEELKVLNKLAWKIEDHRLKSGAIDFDDLESDIEVIYDENNKPVRFVSNRQRSAEKLIENFMLLAGEGNANYMMLPTAYRVHESPSQGAIEDAMLKLHKLGVKVPGLIVKEKKDKMHPEKKGEKVVSVRNVVNGNVLSRIIHSIEDDDLRVLAANIILCAMKRARIDENPEIGHYALGTRKITRVTSGIRRAEDDIATSQMRKQRDVLYDVQHFDQEVKADSEWIAKEAEYITMKQLNAEKAEKAAIQLKMAEYMEEHLGEEFSAVVTYVNEQGIFIRTKNGVTGKISPNDYLEDKLIYDDSTLTYVGAYTDVVIHVGKRLTVIPIDTHREFRTINFGVANKNTKKLIKKRGA